MLGTSPLGGRPLGGSASPFGAGAGVLADTHDPGPLDRRYLDWWLRKRQEIADRDKPPPIEEPEVEPEPLAPAPIYPTRVVAALAGDPEEDDIQAILAFLEAA